MVALMCKICGGDTKLSLGKTHGVCSACGSTTTFPRISSVERVDLFNKGNWLRIHRGDFNSAAYVFEKMIKLDAKDAEAHWCLVMCRYGIIYARDPKSGICIPICRRGGINSLQTDANFREALKNSDYNTASIYISEAKRIVDIQKAILAEAKNIVNTQQAALTETAAGGADAKNADPPPKNADAEAKAEPLIAAEASFETLFENGRTCLRLHNYDAAKKIFSRAAKENPNDYRVWWSLILCMTEALTKLSGDWATLNSLFARVKRLAEPDVFAPFEEEYIAYAQKIAGADAAKDIEVIGNIVKRENAGLSQFLERLKNAQKEKKEREGLSAKVVSEYGEMVKNAVESLTRYSKRLKLSGLLTITAIFFLVAAFPLWFVKGVFFGAALALSVIIIAADKITLSVMARELGGGGKNAAETIKNAVAGLERISEKTAGEKAALEKSHQENMARLEKEIEFLDGEAAQAKERLKPYEDYLALGKEKIQSMFFAWRCNSFGVTREAEDGDATAKLRKAAFALPEARGVEIIDKNWYMDFLT